MDTATAETIKKLEREKKRREQNIQTEQARIDVINKMLAGLKSSTPQAVTIKD